MPWELRPYGVCFAFKSYPPVGLGGGWWGDIGVLAGPCFVGCVRRMVGDMAQDAGGGLGVVGRFYAAARDALFQPGGVGAMGPRQLP
jgi:hypothetical protein